MDVDLESRNESVTDSQLEAHTLTSHPLVLQSFYLNLLIQASGFAHPVGVRS
jgi:hypothetical protein